MTQSVFYDRHRRKPSWVTVHKGDVIVETVEHETEQAARKAIGLKGGSADPEYRPPAGTTGAETAQTTTKGKR
jgi:hypothetical protein